VPHSFLVHFHRHSGLTNPRTVAKSSLLPRPRKRVRSGREEPGRNDCTQSKATAKVDVGCGAAGHRIPHYDEKKRRRV
jgi:hypothetical protein